MSAAPRPIARALISVSDKEGVAEFAGFLADQGVEILSTGGTARLLEEADVPVKEVSRHTGFPEIMDGRVKTLHPKIHGGLLARRDVAGHREAMTDYGIAAIDLLVVNLYPFEETVARGAPAEEIVENIDIGGPAMIRAAAKNHAFVTVVAEPADYTAVRAEMTEFGGTTRPETRRALAAKAFARTAAYDAAIARWLTVEVGGPAAMTNPIAVAGRRVAALRYGENPHQQASLYRTGDRRPGVVGARQLQGKELSYNNILDTDAAYELVAMFDRPAAAIIKHANPCGVAIGESLAQAWFKALACDPVSAFGGIVALNRTLDVATAHAIAEIFVEVVIAPDVEPAAAEALAGKKTLRLLAAGAVPDPAGDGLIVRTVAGGLLVQTRDSAGLTAHDLDTVTDRAPTDAELDDLLFAAKVAKHVKSNAIVYAKGGATVGIGAGQTSRVDSARIAARKAADAARAEGESGSRLAGSVAASDAFFPFADGLEVVLDAGATAVIQPGGSVRDREVIDTANRAGAAMLFSGRRSFRH